MTELQFVVPEGESGRLDTVLTELVSLLDDPTDALTRSQIKKRISAGLISINGITASKAGSLVEAGDEIVVEEFVGAGDFLKPYEYAVSFLYEDDSIAVVDKPPHLTVHPGAGTGYKTLLNALVGNGTINTKNFPGSPRPGIVHRLDKETSGILVVAKNTSALSNLSQQFQERTTHKEYVTLALRKPRGGLEFDSEDSGTIESPIGREPNQRTRMAVVEGGKSALTNWVVEERFTHGVLLRIVIHTGRTHQIRVHLDHIGSGVIGDSLYGNFDTLSPKSLQLVEQLGRQALHAHRLEFSHPVTGERMKLESPIPDDLQFCIDGFRAHES